jgi:hypothetical protein
MDARLFQEAIRSATVTYPIPFMFGVLLLFALLCLGGSAFVDKADWLHDLLAIVGAISGLSAIGIAVYAIRFNPDLLRSEHHVLRMTVANIIGDKEMDPATRDHLSRTVLDVGDHLGPKSVTRDRAAGTSDKGEEADD